MTQYVRSAQQRSCVALLAAPLLAINPSTATGAYAYVQPIPKVSAISVRQSFRPSSSVLVAGQLHKIEFVSPVSRQHTAAIIQRSWIDERMESLRAAADELAVGQLRPSPEAFAFVQALLNACDDAKTMPTEVYLEGDGEICVIFEGDQGFADIGISPDMKIAAYLSYLGDEYHIAEGTPIADVPVDFWSTVFSI